MLIGGLDSLLHLFERDGRFIPSLCRHRQIMEILLLVAEGETSLSMLIGERVLFFRAQFFLPPVFLHGGRNAAADRLICEVFFDEVDNGGGECQSLLPLLPVERLIGQSSRDSVWIAGWDIIEVKSPCPRDGIKSTVVGRGPAKKVRDGMTEHSLLAGEVEIRLDGFFCCLLGQKADQIISLAGKCIPSIVEVTFRLL